MCYLGSMAISKASKPRPLTLKQRKFVEALPLSNSATEAAIKAGYSNSSEAASVRATELVRNSRVVPAIVAAQQALAGAAIADARERKTWLSKVLRNVNADEPQTTQAGLAASDQLNRMERIYAPETPGSTYNDNRTQVLMAYSVEQLEALLVAMKAGERKALAEVIVQDSTETEQS